MPRTGCRSTSRSASTSSCSASSRKGPNRNNFAPKCVKDSEPAAGHWTADCRKRRTMTSIRRMLAGGVLAAGVLGATTASAQAAVTASFSSANGVLTVTGDALNNNIAISRDAAGNILVNGGAVAVLGGTATVANTSTIQVF